MMKIVTWHYKVADQAVIRESMYRNEDFSPFTFNLGGLGAFTLSYALFGLFLCLLLFYNLSLPPALKLALCLPVFYAAFRIGCKLIEIMVLDNATAQVWHILWLPVSGVLAPFLGVFHLILPRYKMRRHIITDEGIINQIGRHKQPLIPYQTLHRVAKSQGHYVVMIGLNHKFVIPYSAFRWFGARLQFEKLLQRHGLLNIMEASKKRPYFDRANNWGLRDEVIGVIIGLFWYILTATTLI